MYAHIMIAHFREFPVKPMDHGITLVMLVLALAVFLRTMHPVRALALAFFLGTYATGEVLVCEYWDPVFAAANPVIGATVVYVLMTQEWGDARVAVEMDELEMRQQLGIGGDGLNAELERERRESERTNGQSGNYSAEYDGQISELVAPLETDAEEGYWPVENGKGGDPDDDEGCRGEGCRGEGCRGRSPHEG